MDPLYDRMVTLVKFRDRSKSIKKVEKVRKGVAPHLLTRTCMKIGVVDQNWLPPSGMEIPNPGEWWFVHIVRETHPGQNHGVLILRPIQKVEQNSMNILVPGFFETERPNEGTLVITPKNDPHGHWYLPLRLKNEMMARRGLSVIVVNLGGGYWSSCGQEDGKSCGADGDVSDKSAVESVLRTHLSQALSKM